MAILVGQAALIGELRTRKPGTEAENETAAADDVIGHRGLHCGIERMREVDELHRGAHADALGQRRRFAHQQFGHRQRVDLADIDRLAVVLADIGVAKTELVRENDFIEVLLVGRRRAGVGTKAVRKKPEFHCHSSIFGSRLRPHAQLDNAQFRPRMSARKRAREANSPWPIAVLRPSSAAPSTMNLGGVPNLRAWVTGCLDRPAAREAFALKSKSDGDTFGRGQPPHRANQSAMSSRPGLINLGQMLGEAVVLQRQGNLRDAEKAYARILKIAPDNFDALNLLGAVKAQQGRIGEAHRLFSAAVKVQPRAPQGWANLGQALHELKRGNEALECLDKARALAPDDISILSQHANTLLSLGRPGDALAEFQQLLLRTRGISKRVSIPVSLKPRSALPSKRLWQFDAALALAPGHPIAQFNRGVALLKLGRYAEALAANDAALAAAPEHSGALLNRGRALAQLNRLDAAIASYEALIARHKDHADAHSNLALTLLTRGDYRRGFAEYEWRWRRTGMPAPKNRGRLWLGEFPLARKTILLHAEQGLGDTIQFARYVPRLVAAGASVVLEVPAELKTLMAGFDGAATVIARGEAPPPFDVHCPLGSLPLALQTDLATVPAQIPYLAADATRLAKWSAAYRWAAASARCDRLVGQCQS